VESVAFLLFSIPARAQKQKMPRIPPIITDIQKRRVRTHTSGVLRVVPARGHGFRE
jgi:hypothetical protein